ncbi:hypothetical protein H920_19678 [Fukomys damarensis]|uniref:Uncharacterized protein n=1 Tax=Fukomys damarensis TaxID=885580 RepID=A0A091CK07_FUKDA|nr:hypothetical protein H920_19678 [Fukomys damarensis]
MLVQRPGPWRSVTQSLEQAMVSPCASPEERLPQGQLQHVLQASENNSSTFWEVCKYWKTVGGFVGMDIESAGEDQQIRRKRQPELSALRLDSRPALVVRDAQTETFTNHCRHRLCLCPALELPELHLGTPAELFLPPLPPAPADDSGEVDSCLGNLSKQMPQTLSPPLNPKYVCISTAPSSAWTHRTAVILVLHLLYALSEARRFPQLDAAPYFGIFHSGLSIVPALFRNEGTEACAVVPRCILMAVRWSDIHLVDGHCLKNKLLMSAMS